MAFPNVSSELLRTFVSVVESDGFLRAAKRLHKTQSTVSQHVRKLEDEIGAALFQPAGRKRKLTSAGGTFYGYARRMLDLQDTALAAIRRPDLEGQLRLGVTNSLSDGPFPQILARFSRVYPRVQVHVQIAYSAELKAAYERGEFDAAIVIEEHGKAMSGTILELNQLVWIGPSDFQWDKSSPLPIATFDVPCGFHKATTEALDRARIPWRLVYTTSSVTGLIAAVRAGIAVTARTPHALQAGTALVQESLGLPVLPSYDVILLRSKTMPAGEILEEMLLDSALKAS
jgi:DNA-binding transcriptional LysR family regulator